MGEWFVCRVTSGRRSAWYGVWFSYPLFISLVILGVILVNPYILAFAALVSLLGTFLAMHPFDYIYNYGIAKMIGIKQIPGRGSEMQVNSFIALIFCLIVIALMVFGAQINFKVLALIYFLMSTLFITIQLFRDDFSLFSIYNFFLKRGK